MIGEFERYHGAVIRQLVVGMKQELCISVADESGRINAFMLNRKVGVYIKHSSKRLPPWQFTYQDAHLEEIDKLKKKMGSIWLIHACGRDGIVAISLDEFYSMNPVQKNTTSFVRVDRDRHTMYRVNGTGSRLEKPKKRGLDCIFEELRD